MIGWSAKAEAASLNRSLCGHGSKRVH